jgi:Uma2 family endonuclease
MAVTITDWPLTLEQFLALPEAKPALEYGPKGQVSQKMSPTTDHGALQIDLGGRLNEYAKSRRLGRAYTEHRVNIGGRSVVPDVTYYGASRPPARPYPTTPPDLAIEIASPGQSPGELADRCAWYVEQGSTLALLVDPEARTIQAFSKEQPQTLSGADVLPVEDVLPGLQLTVDEVFSALA